MRKIILTLAAAISVGWYSPLQAAIHTYDSWHLDTDSFGGLRQSTWDEDVYFAVSDSNVWNPADTYEAPLGFHVASTAEGESIFTPGLNTGSQYVYYDQGGWTDYRWEGLTRYYFRFSDSDVTNAYKHAGNYDPYRLQITTSLNNHAGFVLIKDTVSTSNVPEPTSLLVWSMLSIVGLKRRRHKA